MTPNAHCNRPAAYAPPVFAPPASGIRLNLHEAGDDDRDEVEAFIAEVYARRYGATLSQFAPRLVSLRDPRTGALVAAAGYRVAGGQALFLERYLPAPVEQLIADRQGHPVARSSIVECGQLAASRAGEGRRLIHLLGLHLSQQPLDWVVSTLTQELRHLFDRLGVAPLMLGEARADAVGDDLPAWGSYYEHHPVVLAGRLTPSLNRMASRGELGAGGLAA